jgi:uncharacterized tellurite resistance protein B-like protein
MFANVMNQSEKEKFLELIYKIAQCDEEYSEEEEEILNNYKAELGMENVNDTDTLEGLVTFFAGKSPELKKIVFFELYGMIMADRKIEKNEAELMEMIEKAFGLPESQYKDIISVAEDLRNVYERVYEVLF